jgi:hypothetical protein
MFQVIERNIKEKKKKLCLEQCKVPLQIVYSMKNILT